MIGSNNSGTGDTNVSDVPDWDPKFHGQVISGTVDHRFNSQALVLPLAGTFGNVSRGSLTGPHLVKVDTSVFKRFNLNERMDVQLRVQAFNILNHTNFFYPNAIVFHGGKHSPTAGQITAAGDFAATPARIEIHLLVARFG